MTQPTRAGLRRRGGPEVDRQLVAGQRVRLELDVQERDRYGRLLAYAWVERDGTAVLVKAELLASGTPTS